MEKKNFDIGLIGLILKSVARWNIVADCYKYFATTRIILKKRKIEQGTFNY